ncbi:hypothetical protein M885DRAFT_557228 [Pelagophyceae sp. CCMP2097]|nr:hypothetical protein M885DRAFT_557228 [Pelagophyceae sp. CCMP2097]
MVAATAPSKDEGVVRKSTFAVVVECLMSRKRQQKRIAAAAALRLESQKLPPNRKNLSGRRLEKPRDYLSEDWRVLLDLEAEAAVAVSAAYSGALASLLQSYVGFFAVVRRDEFSRLSESARRDLREAQCRHIRAAAEQAKRRWAALGERREDQALLSRERVLEDCRIDDELHRWWLKTHDLVKILSGADGEAEAKEGSLDAALLEH